MEGCPPFPRFPPVPVSPVPPVPVSKNVGPGFCKRIRAKACRATSSEIFRCDDFRAETSAGIVANKTLRSVLNDRMRWPRNKSANESARSTRRVDWIWNSAILGAAAILVAWQLFVPPVLSVANNGDFQKLAGPVCLGPDPRVGNEFFDYANLHWRFSTEACANWPFRTSAEIVLHAAIGLDRLFRLKPEFDLRWMGALYAILFLANIAWAQKLLRPVRPATSRILQIAFLLIICNAVYIPMFNTFYFDTMALVMMIGALAGVAALLMNGQVTITTLLITSGALTLLAASKSQHAPLAVLCLPAFWITRGRAFPAPWARVLGSVLIVAGVAVSTTTIPPDYAGATTFDTLFYRILPAVPDPKAYLGETRIPSTYPWERAIGKHSFQPDSPNFTSQQQIAFGHVFGLTDLELFFLRHPDRAWFMMRMDLDEGSLDRVRMKVGEKEYKLGNYERSTGKPPQTLSQFFTLWPALKGRLLGGHPRRYLIYILSLIVLAWLFAPRVPGMLWYLMVITTMLVVAFAVVMLDGVDTGRHLRVFNYLTDLIACGIAALAGERLLGRFESRQNTGPLLGHTNLMRVWNSRFDEEIGVRRDCPRFPCCAIPAVHATRGNSILKFLNYFPIPPAHSRSFTPYPAGKEFDALIYWDDSAGGLNRPRTVF